jgi:transaldolase
MSSPLRSLIACGTKIWLDSIDPELVAKNRAMGATGATSNPIIVADLIKTGRFDQDLDQLIEQKLSDEQIAWAMTDQLVSDAQTVFRPAWEQTHGNDGYVSFELDPLLEDPQLGPPHAQRVARYVELGKHWSRGHVNRMMKVPATSAGIDALEELAAAGVTLNVTLIFTLRQYRAARNSIWRGAERLADRGHFKSVYSIFVSRVDVYTEQHVPQLSPAAQGMTGIVGAKRIWAENQQFWRDKKLPLDQEIVFASTGTKKPEDPPWKYAAAFAGSDIETNPPATNDAIEKSGRTFQREVDKLPSSEVLAEIDREVNVEHLEATLMAEGIKKFADPQKALLAIVERKRAALTTAR